MKISAQTVILGGGTVGRLAASLLPDAIVLDWRKKPSQASLARGVRPLGAVYLHEPIPGLEHREVKIETTIDGEPGTPGTAQAYKYKIGKREDVSDTTRLMLQFPYQSRGHALVGTPEPGKGQQIWNAHVRKIWMESQELVLLNGDTIQYGDLISTIPLNSLLPMIGIDAPLFKYEPICVKVAPVPPDVPPPAEGCIRVNYLTDPRVACYRTTDRDGERHYEWLQSQRGGRSQLGIPTRVIVPGKIWPNPESESILEFLEQFSIRCFGRFATWRPDELLHHTYKHMTEMHR